MKTKLFSPNLSQLMYSNILKSSSIDGNCEQIVALYGCSWACPSLSVDPRHLGSYCSPHSFQSYVWFGFIVYIALQNWVSHKLDFAARLLTKDWLSPTISCQTSLYHKRDQLWSNLYKDVTFPVNPKSDHTVSRQSIIKPSDLQDYRLTWQWQILGV